LGFPIQAGCSRLPIRAQVLAVLAADPGAGFPKLPGVPGRVWG